MYLSKSLMTGSHWLVIAILVLYVSLSAFAPVYLSMGQANESYTYYGVVPSKIYRYELNDGNNLTSGWKLGLANDTRVTGSIGLNGTLVATRSMLAIVAAEDDTNVEVYNLTLNSWMQVWSGSLNSMEKQLVLLDNGTTFKVVSDKIVSVLLLNYQQLPSGNVNEGPTPQTFYTDVNGSYVGKEFVFMASEFQAGAYFTVLALEKAEVTVTNSTGYTVYQFSLDTNAYKTMVLDPFRVYKIESSTGNIMVQSCTIWDATGCDTLPCFLVPSAEGGFVGKFFLTTSIEGWDTERDYGYRVSASEDTHVTVYDLDTKQVIKDFSVEGGTGIAFQPAANAIAVESDNPITLAYIDNGSLEQSPSIYWGQFGSYPNGVMFMGIQPNQDTVVHLPTDAHVEAYFFASNQTQLTIDGTAYTIQAGSSFFYNLPGTHTVESDNNAILQVDFWPLEPAYQGLWFTGAVVPCIETVASSPSVTLTPLGGAFPIMYVMVGVAAVAVVAVVACLLLMRRRGSKPS